MLGWLKKINKTKSEKSQNINTPENISEILKKVKEIELKTKDYVSQTLAGEYHSIFKGQGIDFDRVREYNPGDEIKTIDWNVTARTGKPYVKLYTEERELTLLLMIDISASEDFGSGSKTKKSFIAEIAATLALSALKNKDKVGLILFSDQIEKYIKPAKGRRNLLKIIREIIYHKPKGKGTDIIKAIEYAEKVERKHCSVFLISDFRIPTYEHSFYKKFSNKLRVLGKHHDAVAISINDPLEFDIPQVGILSCQDPESGKTININTNSQKTLDWLKQTEEKRLSKLKKMIKAQGLDYLELTNHKNFIPALMNFFKNRHKR